MMRTRKVLGRMTTTTALLALAGCGAAATVPPTNDFNRPTDIQFMCFGAFGPEGGEHQVSGRPMRSCHPSGKLNMFTMVGDQAIDDGRDPAPGLTARTFAFIANSASGDLSMVDTDRWQIIDLATSNSGFGRVPLGAVPEQIAASQDGCRLISANRGACDLTLIDPSAYVQPVIQAENAAVSIAAPDLPQTAPRAPIDGNQKPLQVAPYEVAFLPQDTSALQRGPEAEENLCQHDAAQTPTPWRVLVTYPSCDLVALVDMPSFEIVDSVKVTLDGNGRPLLVPQGKTPVCPISDCGAGRMEPVAAPPQTRPSSIAIVPTGDRAYVGLSSAPFIISLAMDPAAGTFGAGNAIDLHGGAVGSNRIRLGVDPFRYADPADHRFAGKFVGGDQARNFLYVIARDGTLAVIDVLLPGQEKECETNPDPQNPPPGSSRDQSCIPPDTEHRRPGADGPALRFPTAPVDVAAADIPFGRGMDSDTREESVGGGYAWVLTASGATYLVNIDPVLRRFTAFVETVVLDENGKPENGADGKPKKRIVPAQTVEEAPYVNTVRDRNLISYSLSLDPSSGPPRVEVPPTAPVSGPYIESFWTKGTDNDATALDGGFRQTAIFFHDRSAVSPQAWSVTWQGTIIGSRYAGRLYLRDDKTTVLQDDGVDFCYSGPGVIAGDLVTIGGCTEDAECGPGLACLKDPNADAAAGGLKVLGLCVNKENLDSIKKGGTCASFLRTIRRYEIVAAHGQTLELMPHLDEVIRSKLTPCRIPPQTPQTAPPPNDCADPTDPSTATYFTCQADPLGDDQAPPRCLRQCESDSDCRQGRICQVLKDRDGKVVRIPDPMDPTKEKDGTFCAEAPPFEGQTECFYQLLRYDVRVGRGFLVSGTVAGIPGSVTKLPIVDDSGAPPECTPAPRNDPTKRDYRQVSRIAIDGPAANLCPPELNNHDDSRPRPDTVGSGAESGKEMSIPGDLASAVKEGSASAGMLRRVKSNPNPNPCLFIGGPVLSDPAYQDSVLPEMRPQHVRALFQNTEVSFILANLDRSPPGSLDLRFDVRGGFRPQTVIQPSTVEISMPTRIVLGPIDSQKQDGTVTDEVPYIFVVDQRRQGLGLGGGPTRGQLLRIHPRGYDSTLTAAGGVQPIFQDYTASGKTFPIQ